MVSPVNDPLTEDFVSAGAAAGVGEFVAALFVALELFEEEFELLELLELLGLFEVLFDEVLLFLVALLLVAFLAVTFEEVALALASGVAATGAPEVAAEAPAIVPKPLLDNCGGVTDKTAPRPPTVPPAINNARFIPFTLVFPY